MLSNYSNESVQSKQEDSYCHCILCLPKRIYKRFGGIPRDCSNPYPTEDVHWPSHVYPVDSRLPRAVRLAPCKSNRCSNRPSTHCCNTSQSRTEGWPVMPSGRVMLSHETLWSVYEA